MLTLVFLGSTYVLHVFSSFYVGSKMIRGNCIHVIHCRLRLFAVFTIGASDNKNIKSKGTYEFLQYPQLILQPPYLTPCVGTEPLTLKTQVQINHPIQNMFYCKLFMLCLLKWTKPEMCYYICKIYIC